MLQGLFKKNSKEQIFWDWFSKRSKKYFNFENNRDELFAELKTQLENIDPNLVFEFSTTLKEDIREFIISADGIQSSFPSVIKLLKYAPKLEHWKFIAFRQPHPNILTITYQQLVVSLNDVFFRYAKDKGKIGLELYLKGFHESSEWTTLSFILIDTILGEYDTETRISWMEKKALDESSPQGLISIKELPKIVKEYKIEFNN